MDVEPGTSSQPTTTDPTAAIGMPLAVNTMLEYAGDLSRIKFIEQTVGGKLNVTYFA